MSDIRQVGPVRLNEMYEVYEPENDAWIIGRYITRIDGVLDTSRVIYHMVRFGVPIVAVTTVGEIRALLGENLMRPLQTLYVCRYEGHNLIYSGVLRGEPPPQKACTAWHTGWIGSKASEEDGSIVDWAKMVVETPGNRWSRFVVVA